MALRRGPQPVLLLFELLLKCIRGLVGLLELQSSLPQSVGEGGEGGKKVCTGRSFWVHVLQFEFLDPVLRLSEAFLVGLELVFNETFGLCGIADLRGKTCLDKN